MSSPEQENIERQELIRRIKEIAEKLEKKEDWEIILYQNAVADIRWAKEQGWKAIQLILLLFAAIYGLSYKLKDETGLLVYAALFVAIVGIIYLIDLNCFARKTRNTEKSGHRERLKQTNRYHNFYLLIEIAITLLGLYFTLELIHEQSILSAICEFIKVRGM